MTSPEVSADSGEAKKRSAGRNLPAAIAVGVGVGVVAVLCLFVQPWLFVGLACIVICIGIWELSNAFANRDIRIARTPIYIGAVASSFATYEWGVPAQLVTFGTVVVLIFIWRVRRGVDGYVKDITASVFVTAYLPFMVGFVMLSLSDPDGQLRVITFVALTICSDIGGYATGVLFGKHPIAPQISPKKSWEGFAGSVVLQAVVGAWLFVWFFQAPWWQGVITGIIMTISATAGDFCESAIKRDLGVKDMSKLLPGHGGVMDRLDSLIPNAFVSWALFYLFLGV